MRETRDRRERRDVDRVDSQLVSLISRVSRYYPTAAYSYELVSENQAIIRPDLVYNEGDIRRRYSGSLPTTQGTSFFELSEAAGIGASGAPVCKNTAPGWDVIGIYVGEKLNDRATSVSYAVREEIFRDWAPQILGNSVLAESQNVTISL